MTPVNLSVLGLFAIQYVGIPYLWGGQHPMKGFDCSGFIQTCLEHVGLDPIGDQTAQGLYNKLSKRNWKSGLDTDSILFFGKDTKNITHIALALTDHIMIHAGSGNSKTVNLEEAIKRNARVKIEPISRRRDLIASIIPKY